MQLKSSPVNRQCILPVLFRRGQYLQSLLLQKDSPRADAVWGFFCMGVVPGLGTEFLAKLVSELEGLGSIGLKKSLMDLCCKGPVGAKGCSVSVDVALGTAT